jgi:hypothetical protein
MGGDAGGYYVLEHPDEWRGIPKEYRDRLFEAIDDWVETLYGTGTAVETEKGPEAELAGVTNALCCAHDVLSIFKEAGVTPPKIYTEIHRTLENRRAELDPGQAQGHHL